VPVRLLQYVFLLWIYAVSIVIWFVAVATARTSAELVDAARTARTYMARSFAYSSLLTDRWPPLKD
jgi:type IV secretory pathway TrbD component